MLAESVVATVLVHNKKSVLIKVSVITVGGLMLLGGAAIIALRSIDFRPQEPQMDCAIARGLTCVSLEEVSSDEDLLQGLSGRASMPMNHGMLFVFPRVGRQCIWMKDMQFSLDIIWLNKKKEIIKILPAVSPSTYPESFCVDDAKYVIELNSGVADESYLAVGRKLAL